MSKDPDEAPEMTPELVAEAVARNLVIVAICCDHESPTEDSGMVSFLALAAAVPRIGEHVTLEDGVRAKVVDVDHVCVRHRGIPHLVANVRAFFTHDLEQI